MDKTAYKLGTFSQHDPEHPWQAGTGSVTVEKQNNTGTPGLSDLPTAFGAKNLKYSIEQAKCLLGK